MRHWLSRFVFALALVAAWPAYAAFELGTGICETTTSTGTGTINLAGAYTSGTVDYLSFDSQITSGNPVPYTIESSDGKFEHGTGTFTDGSPDTLSRTAAFSSNGVGTALTLPAGTHIVCLQWGEETFLGGNLTPWFASIELGNASDTTLARSGAGTVTIEGAEIITGNPVTVAKGGTGQTTEAEALGEMTQALTEDTAPDYTADFVPVYDASADTGKKVKLQNLRGAGEFFWYTASSSCPAYSLKADGSTVSRTTYARLWSAVSAIASGTPDDADYGTGDGSTTFRLPNLTTDRHFIRAGTFGTEQADAAPNITGTLTASASRRVFASGSGAFSMTTPNENTVAAGSSTSAAASVGFNASNSNAKYGAASEVRPVNVSWTPCIVF